MKKNWQKFCFCRGLLHRKVEDEKPQLVPPAKYIPIVCKALRDDMGHQGLILPKILVNTGHFTRFAMAVPTRNISAKTTVEALLPFVKNFGIPKRLHANQGDTLSIVRCREVQDYIISSNGKWELRADEPNAHQCARRTLPEHKKKDWTSHIGMLVVAYKSNKSDSSGFSPYFLMFGKNRGSLLITCFLFSQSLENSINSSSHNYYNNINSSSYNYYHYYNNNNTDAPRFEMPGPSQEWESVEFRHLSHLNEGVLNLGPTANM
ncbi:hypothetical protein RRG08_060891 [Elysia crispata]|uniref:Uncharacterized protein n=1 Tax=Elysia crispata TaxID=231223 RepID=A0AAE1CLY6_9GAST|nr:hypothetical protein RRG08_060891 [Elysia crispata]